MDPDVRQYLETALWGSFDGDGMPLDRSYTVRDFAPEAVAIAEKTLAAFRERCLKEAAPDIRDRLNRVLDNHAMPHDLWLTQNRYGAGFWDGDYDPDVGEILTKWAHAMGERYVFESYPDGLLRFG